MADEYVTIKIKVNADAKDINNLNRKLAQLGATAKLVDKATNDLGATMNRRFDPAARKMKSRLMGIASALSTFNKLALKVFGVTFIVAAASLASVNALFAVGRFAVQAYRVAMQGLAVGVTAVGAALAVVASAQREYNAALYAYSYKASPALGKGLNQSRAALRMLQSDSTLAVFGMEALNASFATLSKSGQVTGQTVGALRAFADFAAAGGDPSKNLEGIAEVLSMIEKKGKLTQEAIDAAGNVNEVFSTALKKANSEGKSSYKDLVQFIETSGIKAELGIEGQSELLGNTLVGKFKRFTTNIKSLFADIGQPLLGPVSEAFEKMFRIIRNGIVRLAPEFIKFGSGRMLDGLVKATQKLTDALVNLTRKYLAGSEGMIQRFNNFWQKTVYVFNRVVDAMRPLLDGGRAVIDIFGPALGEVFGKVGDIIKQLDKIITNNREEWTKFGKALQEAVELLGDFIIMMFDVFDRALPLLTPLIEAFTDLARVIMMVPRALSSIPGSLGSLGALLSMFGFLAGGMALKNFTKYKVGKLGVPGASGGASSGGAQGFGMGTTIISGAQGLMGGGRSGRRGFGSYYREARGMGFGRRDAYGLALHDSGKKIGAMGKVGMGKGVGTGLALGLMTPYVDEKARSGVAMGGTLASMAPMMGKYGKLGLAGGVALAGGSIAMNATTAKGGALGGAMAGAAIGSFVPVIGTIGGAIIGGIAGGIKGFFKGRSNKINKLAKEKTGELYNSLANAMVRGNTDAVRDALVKQRSDAKKRLKTGEGTSIERKADEKYLDNIKTVDKVLKGPLERFDKVVGTLETTTGKTKEEIMSLANEIGLNLYDDSIAFTDVIKQMGAAMTMTGEQFKAAMYDMAVSQMGFLDEKIQAIEAQEVIKEEIDRMRELLLAGPVDQLEVFKFAKTFEEQLLMLNPDKPFGIKQEMFDKFGKGGLAYQPGMEFAGMESIMEPLLRPYLDSLEADLPNVRKITQEQIASGFLEKGYRIDSTQLTTALAGMGYQELQTLLTAISTGGMYSPGVGGMGVQENLNNVLGASGYGGTVGLTRTPFEEPTTFEDMSAEESAIRAEFMTTMEAFFAQQPPDWMKEMPPWWNNESHTHDTATPRGDTTSSRLGTTLSRHNYLNNQLTGKRSITSSYRTTGLGSINSDHVTGKAYDLVGQNLGAYAKLTNSMGGFAEFHGSGGSRHLHVVPGETPIGDTTMPSMVTSNSLPSSTVNNSYNVVVNGGNDSAEKIAKHVMDEITRIQRSAKERR